MIHNMASDFEKNVPQPRENNLKRLFTKTEQRKMTVMRNWPPERYTERLQRNKKIRNDIRIECIYQGLKRFTLGVGSR